MSGKQAKEKTDTKATATRGRPRNVEQMLEPYIQVAAVRALGVAARECRWTIRKAIDAFEAAEKIVTSDETGSLASYGPHFTVEDSTMSQIIKGHIPNARLINAIWIWMSHTYPDIYLPLEAEERVRAHEQGVIALSQWLGEGDHLDFDKARTLSGTYALYRPSHVKPTTEIMRAKLVIGTDADMGFKRHEDVPQSEFNCIYQSQFEEDGSANETFAAGKIVPHGNSLMVILATALNPT